jgi:hypothetical protein
MGLEIGVKEGKNAETIQKIFNFETLILVDPWVNQKNRAADSDHSNSRHEEYYQETKERFRSDPRVHIRRTYSSSILGTLKNESFDFIYIDGDHSYEGAKHDLKFIRKVKLNGIFAGHDFTNNKHSMTRKGYGVQKAVMEFMQLNDLKLDYATINTPRIKEFKDKIPWAFANWAIIKRDNYQCL